VAGHTAVRCRVVDWVARVTGVRRWTRGQERAPHKPLLLLYALGHFQHEDLCAELGLDIAAARRRDREFRSLVLTAYEYQCAFCGFEGWLNGRAVGLDAAHVQWWAFGGPDEVANGLCLCALHHRLFDKGVLGVTADHRVAVSVHYVGRGTSASAQVLALAGRAVGRPQAAYPRVADARVSWHGREVFRAPARV
jgi:putative restriction endonuclease